MSQLCWNVTGDSPIDLNPSIQSAMANINQDQDIVQYQYQLFLLRFPMATVNTDDETFHETLKGKEFPIQVIGYICSILKVLLAAISQWPASKDAQISLEGIYRTQLIKSLLLLLRYHDPLTRCDYHCLLSMASCRSYGTLLPSSYFASAVHVLSELVLTSSKFINQVISFFISFIDSFTMINTVASLWRIKDWN